MPRSWATSNWLRKVWTNWRRSMLNWIYPSSIGLKEVNMNPIFFAERKSWRALIVVSPKKVKANGKWCSPKKGKLNVVLQNEIDDYQQNKYLFVSCLFQYIGKKSNLLRNMHSQMRMTIKKIHWTFKRSKQLMVRHLRHISLLHIQHRNMKRPNKLRHIHHQLAHLFSINLVKKTAKFQFELEFDTFTNLMSIFIGNFRRAEQVDTTEKPPEPPAFRSRSHSRTRSSRSCMLIDELDFSLNQ